MNRVTSDIDVPNSGKSSRKCEMYIRPVPLVIIHWSAPVTFLKIAQLEDVPKGILQLIYICPSNVNAKSLISDSITP